METASGERALHTRRSSRFPSTGLCLESDFDSVCFGGGDSFFGSGFFSLGAGGGGLDSSLGFGSSFDGLGSEDVGCSLEAGSFGVESAFSSFPPSGGPPSSRRRRSWPTVTVSSSFTKNSLIVPASGALTATSIWWKLC